MEQTLVRQERIHLLDTLRGLSVIAMIGYHGLWDLVYIFGEPITWYTQWPGYIYQRMVCCSFIFLSGYCVSLGKHGYRRGLMVSGAGVAITMATVLFMPSNIVIFGILTFIGASMLLTTALKPYLDRAQPWIAIALCALAYYVLGNGLLPVPQSWYSGYLSTFLGFPFPGFYSTDYFPLLPWLPLFWAGYFASRLGLNLPTGAPHPLTAPLRFCGRHALGIYMIHQPLLYAVLWLVYEF